MLAGATAIVAPGQNWHNWHARGYGSGGMILVTLPKCTPGFRVSGMHWGPHGRSGGPRMEAVGVTDEMRLAAWHHGAKFARMAGELGGKQLLANGNIDPEPEMLRTIQMSEP